MDEATITLEGEPLTEDEQWAMMMVWCASEFGVSPAFHLPEHAHLKPVADGLVGRGLMYRLTGELGPGDDPALAGYSLRSGKADKIAEWLFDSSGMDFGDVAKGRFGKERRT